MEISQAAYNVLLEYAKLDKLDMVLVLQIEGGEAKWCLMDENWLKKQDYGMDQASPTSSNFFVLTLNQKFIVCFHKHQIKVFPNSLYKAVHTRCN